MSEPKGRSQHSPSKTGENALTSATGKWWEPRDDEGNVVITGPTVAGALFWAAVAGVLALGIVVVLGVSIATFHTGTVTWP